MENQIQSNKTKDDTPKQSKKKNTTVQLQGQNTLLLYFLKPNKNQQSGTDTQLKQVDNENSKNTEQQTGFIMTTQQDNDIPRIKQKKPIIISEENSIIENINITNDDIIDLKAKQLLNEMQKEIACDPIVQQRKRLQSNSNIQKSSNNESNNICKRVAIKQSNYEKVFGQKDINDIEDNNNAREQLAMTLEDEQIEIAKSIMQSEEQDEFFYDTEIEQAIQAMNEGLQIDNNELQGLRKRNKESQDDDMVDENELLAQSESSEEEAQMDDLEDELFLDSDDDKKKKLNSKKKNQGRHNQGRNKASDADLGEEEEETIFIDNLPSTDSDIRMNLKIAKKLVRDLEKQFFMDEDSDIESQLQKQLAIQNDNNNNISDKDMNDQNNEIVKKQEQDRINELILQNSQIKMKSIWCIPLSVNVIEYNFQGLIQKQKEVSGRLFDVLTIDPPWQLSSANPTRGVAIAYDTLSDGQIMNLPFNQLQTQGFLFIWVINAKYRFALELLDFYHYKLVDEICWVKQTCNGKIAKGHGYYLQHAKETCLIGAKGDNLKSIGAKFNIYSDVIFSQRRGQSQKPEEIYEIAEALIPNGYYLEIFGRRNNLHNGWVTIGNEI